MPGLPSGTVTFLFTDIEGSTRLWEQYTEAMRLALTRHDDGGVGRVRPEPIRCIAAWLIWSWRSGSACRLPIPESQSHSICGATSSFRCPVLSR